MSAIEVCVGRVAKAHGIRGEVSVEVRTDEPERRFLPGACFSARGKHPALPPRLTVEAVRRHQERLLLRFTEVSDRTAAETTIGALLYVALSAEEVPEDPEEYYDHQLVGLVAQRTDGTPIGTVSEVLHHTAQDLLVITAPGTGTEGREVLVPFVNALVPIVDLAAGRLVVAERPGLLDEPDPGDQEERG